jgi:acetylornithine deacetylase/succinyl-diaminopimelate desuccinylase
MQKVLSQIDHNDTLALLKDLVGIPSHRDVPEQERKVAEYMACRLEKSGIDVELREVTEQRLNVVGVIEGSGEGYDLMFNGHMDTVPAYGWRTKMGPFCAEMKGGRVYGRGTVDMKGGLAAMMVAMQAIKKSGVELKGDLVFTGVVGEEGSCSIGAREIILNGPRTDFAVVGEATSLNVGIANRGSCDFEIITRGKAAHTGEPKKGVNAVLNMVNVTKALEREIGPRLRRPKHRLLDCSVMNISKIEGGIYGDVVPDLCRLWLRIRYVPAYDPKKLKEMINEVLQKVGKKFGFDSEVIITKKSYQWKWGRVIAKPYPAEISKDSRIVKVLRRNTKHVIGKNPKIVGFKGWADSALFINDARIPTAQFGPGNGGAHSPREFLELDQLHKAADIFALTALDLCLQTRQDSQVEKPSSE